MAVLADSTGYGNAGLEDFTKALAAHKLKPAHVGRFDIGVKDMTDAVKAARDSKAQVLFTITVGLENAVIARPRGPRLEGGPGRPVGPHLPDLHRRRQERC